MIVDFLAEFFKNLSDKPMGSILVTGGAGYIGSHTVAALREKHLSVIVLDNLSQGHPDFVQGTPLIVGNSGDRNLLAEIFREHPIDLVIHFASSIDAGESVKNPFKYYENNVVQTLGLLESMRSANIKKIIFSSTCAVYGNAGSEALTEERMKDPINPYGKSKWMVEHILKDYQTSYGIQSILFRYFNAAGAHPHLPIGELHHPETHLIPLVLAVAAGVLSKIEIFGSDYPTPDGTCIRDYVHVCDLAQAHVLGTLKLLKSEINDDFNLGNEKGVSIMEVIQMAQEVTQRSIPYQFSARRPGDSHQLVANSQKARESLGWSPKYKDLRSIIETAWRWYQLNSKLTS